MAHFWCQENTNSDLIPDSLLAHSDHHLLTVPYFTKVNIWTLNGKQKVKGQYFSCYFTDNFTLSWFNF